MGPHDCAMMGRWSTLGARDSLGQILSRQNQFSIWCILKTQAGPVLSWQELAVAGMLNCLFDDLLTMAGLHLLSLAVIRERHKDWCTLLVGHATTALQGNRNLSLNIYLILVYMHIHWSVLPHSSLSPLLFLQLHAAFFQFFFLFKFSPEISTRVAHCRTQRILTPPSFHSLQLLLKSFLGYDLYECLFPEPNFL